jgi:L,D-transpeptidase ErfK/SrfK
MNHGGFATRRLLKQLAFSTRWLTVLFLIAGALTALIVSPSIAHSWSEEQFANRPLYAYPLPGPRSDIIGSLTTYKIQKGDTLLDVGRWFGLSAKEVSDANNHLDWWAPPVGKEIILPTEHILPEGPRVGIVLNIPEMRLYYYYPPPTPLHRRKKLKTVSLSRRTASVVYTFPVGVGRFDWKTPVGAWTVVSKTKDPTWVVPDDIYQEHLERDGEADHVIPGGDPDNPLGHYRLSLSLPEYALHGTNVPWGVGMNVSHGCVRLYPEDIKRLYSKVEVGTPGRFVYQPIKFGWRDESLYVEVHDDLYARYPGLWNYAQHEVQRLGLEDQVDMEKLEKAVELRAGIPTYVMPGPDPGSSSAKTTLPTPAPREIAGLSTVPTKVPATTPVSTSEVGLPAVNRGEAAAPLDTLPSTNGGSAAALPVQVVSHDEGD